MERITKDSGNPGRQGYNLDVGRGDERASKRKQTAKSWRVGSGSGVGVELESSYARDSKESP